MKTILYVNSRGNIGKQLEKKIQEELCHMKVKTLNSIQSLSQTLCRPLNQVQVIIIVIDKTEEITHFLNLAPLLENIRIILLLPDREKQTIALGLKLNPSFISYADTDFKDITAVLKKIQKITKEKL